MEHSGDNPLNRSAELTTKSKGGLVETIRRVVSTNKSPLIKGAKGVVFNRHLPCI